MRMGADLSRIRFIVETRIDDKVRSFKPADDLPHLSSEISRIGDVALVVIDPLVSVLDAKTDSHKNAETRGDLQPVVDLAAKCNLCILGIHHVTKWTNGKTPSERYCGTLAFVALARIGLMTAQAERKGDRDGDKNIPERILTRAKSNIGPTGRGFAYEIEFGPVYESPDILETRIVWGAEQEGYASDIIDQVEGGVRDDGRSIVSNKIQEWLAQFLSGGPKMQKKTTAGGKGEDWRHIPQGRWTGGWLAVAPSGTGGEGVLILGNWWVV
jgi:putative DNA primase/helicase